jgi:DNA-binding beta-propeller fold protein YncE
MARAANGNKSAKGRANARTLLLATVKENVSLTAIDPKTGDVVAAVAVGTPGTAKPHEFTISADGRRAFVSLYGSSDYGRNVPDNRVAVVDLATMTLAGHIDLNLYAGPHAMMTDRDGYIWVTVDPNRCVLVLNPQKWEIERCIWLEAPGHFLAAAPDGETVYFSAKEYPVIVAVDVATRSVTRRIPLPVGGQGIRVSPDGRRLYVGDFHRPLLHVVDLGVCEVVQTVPLTGVPGWPFNSADGKYVIVTTYDEPADRGFVEILDADDLSKRRVVDVPAEPFHVTDAGDGEHVFAALANGRLEKISLRAAKVAPGGFDAGGSMPEALGFVTV